MTHNSGCGYVNRVEEKNDKIEEIFDLPKDNFLKMHVFACKD